MKLAHLKHHAQHEPIWHVQGVIVLAVALELLLPNSLSLGAKYLVAGSEIVLLIILSLLPSKLKTKSFGLERFLAISLLGLISFTNLVSLFLITRDLFGSSHIDGRQLLFSGITIYLTNILVFGLWYWEMDNRYIEKYGTNYDFYFPQDGSNKWPNWSPALLDYVYVSVTNATAFSPTDAMPLRRRTKALMTVQALVALVTVALIVARAVNILA